MVGLSSSKSDVALWPRSPSSHIYTFSWGGGRRASTRNQMAEKEERLPSLGDNSSTASAPTVCMALPPAVKHPQQPRHRPTTTRGRLKVTTETKRCKQRVVNAYVHSKEQLSKWLPTSFQARRYSPHCKEGAASGGRALPMVELMRLRNGWRTVLFRSPPRGGVNILV